MSDLVYHHIGGRAGMYPLPVKQDSPFVDDLRYVVFEADADCAAQIAERNPKLAHRLTVVPACVGGGSGEVDFHITFDPYASSLYPPNPRFAPWTSVTAGNGAHALGDNLRIIETRRVALRTLAEICRDDGVPPPDFLSIDVQGAEFDILAASRDMIAGSALGIELEIEFCEVYAGQKLFSHLHELLDAMGFDLVEMRPGQGFAPLALPIGFMGRERQLAGDAVYLKRLELVAGEEIDDNAVDRLMKAAFLGVLYGQIGYAVACLERVAAHDTDRLVPEQTDDRPRYATFLAGLWTLYQSWPSIHVPAFAEIHNELTSKARFLGAEQIDEHTVRRFNAAKQVSKERIRAKYGALRAIGEKLLNAERTPLEDYLIHHGLEAVARAVADQRRAQAREFVNLTA